MEDGEIQVLCSQLFGKYNFQNIIMVIVVGKYFKVGVECIVVVIEVYIFLNNCFQWVEKDGICYYLDVYNVNLMSM